MFLRNKQLSNRGNNLITRLKPHHIIYVVHGICIQIVFVIHKTSPPLFILFISSPALHLFHYYNVSFQLQQFFLTRRPLTWMNDKKEWEQARKVRVVSGGWSNRLKGTYINVAHTCAYFLWGQRRTVFRSVISPMRAIMKINTNIQEVRLTKRVKGFRALMYGEAIGDPHE